MSAFRFPTMERIPPQVCASATLSTLHGCPPQEIERIAKYLLDEKKVHTFIKCNPTLLGYKHARSILDEMGYGYVSFGEFHFNDDLQYEDAVPMIKRLKKFAEDRSLEFGVKITNTFPVDIKANELPGNEMYMSGKALFPLSMAVAAKLSSDFGGSLRISYSGGADYFNIEKIVAAGIWPVTLATTLLKPGGYQRLLQMAEAFGKTTPADFAGVNTAAVKGLSEKAKTDRHHIKALKPLPSRKMKRKVPLIDCFVSPCEEGCPIHQDIAAYMKLAGEGKMKDALRVIIDKNPLPFITGNICAHSCMIKCTRNFYETPVNIRKTKLEAARGGYDALLSELKKPDAVSSEKAAIVGGGPAGLAAAYFLARGGMQVTLFEKRGSLGGVVRNVIPEFRIAKEDIDKDVKLVEAMGIAVETGKEITSVAEIKKDYDCVVLAIGASEPGMLKLEGGKAMNAIDFLGEFKAKNGCLDIGKNVVVIGGGNTAMDAARAAKRTPGAERVFIVYRRTKRYMPADEEELTAAIRDGVELMELLSPVSFQSGSLGCRRMKLSEPDAGGRRGVTETEETFSVPADTVIAAVGEHIPEKFYRANGIDSEKINEDTLETNIKSVYVIGDGLNGPATVVEAIRDAKKAADAILKTSSPKSFDGDG